MVGSQKTEGLIGWLKSTNCGLTWHLQFSLWQASKEGQLLFQMFIKIRCICFCERSGYLQVKLVGSLAMLSLLCPAFLLVKTVVLNLAPSLLAQVTGVDM